MTDKYVLGKGRLHFRHWGYQMNATTLKDIMEKPYTATVQMEGEIYERFVNAVLFTMRVHWIVGYNPQKLLPAPTFEREFMQSLTEWAAEQSKLPYTEFANSVFNTLTRDGEVTFSPTGRYIKDPMSSAAHALANAMTRIIDAMKPREAPVLVVGTDFADVERKVLNYMQATFVHESAGGSPTPRGKIELFDYDDHTVINLEGSGELPGRRDLVDDLFSGQFARQLGKTASMTAMMHKLERRPAPQKSYLDHDPTKRHGRRKKK